MKLMRIPFLAFLFGAHQSPGVTLGMPEVLSTTWVSHKLQGKLMANGEPYSTEALTAACNLYPLGTKLLVTFFGQHVAVTVTDRMGENDRGLDLSRKAFVQLAPLARGRIPATVRVLNYTQDDF